MTKQTREQLGVKEGDKIVIKGVVAFARIDKAVEGQALERENERRRNLGMIPADRPFRSITIAYPEIVSGQGSPLAQFYQQTIYQGKYQNQNGVPMMSLESKSQYPPQFGHIENGVIKQIPDPRKNPAQGQVVYLLIEAFRGKGYNNLSSSFNSIVYEEGPIRFFEANQALAGFGEALGMPVEYLETNEENVAEPQIAPEAQAQNNPFMQQPQPTVQPTEQPNPFNAGAGTGQPQPNPFGQQQFGMTNQQAQQASTPNTGPFGTSPFNPNGNPNGTQFA